MTFENPGGSALWDFDMIKDKYILLACEDGSPRCLRIKKNNFILHKQFSKQNSKILCIKTNSFDENGSFFSGHNDGTIKKWSFATGQIDLVINLTTSKIKNHSQLIWSLHIIK